MNRLTIAILLLGVGLRTAAFASDRSLWIDEAMVALNIVERSPTQLFEPLDRNQGAPVGFLLATKASVAVFGPTEHALRLPAFLASLVGLVAFVIPSSCLMPRSTRLLALALFAVSPHVVGYAAECKQYSWDAAFAAVLLTFATCRLNRRRGIAFALVGAISVWCSHPALFILAGLGIALFANAIIQRDRSRIIGLVFLGGCWLGSFVAVYSVNLRHLGHNDYLIQYWAGHFAPLPTSREGCVWYVDHALRFANEPAGMTGDWRIAEAVMVLLGAVSLILMLRLGRGQTSLPSPLSEAERGDKIRTAVLGSSFLITVAIALLASGVHLYPFGGRLLLFLVPMSCLIWACGASCVMAWLGSRVHLLAWLIVIWPLIQSVEEIRHPARAEEIKPLLNHVKANWQSGDRIYVYGGSGDAGAGPAFDFYSLRYDFPAGSSIRGGIHREDPTKYRVEISQLPPGRIWVLFTHRHRDEESVILKSFTERGSVEPLLQVPGGSLSLYSPP